MLKKIFLSFILIFSFSYLFAENISNNIKVTDGDTIVINKEKPSVTFEDGRNALILANAAYESFETGKSVRVDYK